MSLTVDHRVRDMGSLQLKLRSDLVFTPQSSASRPYYIVEDPLNSRFFRLGFAEYTFVSLLTGDLSIQSAFRQFSQICPDHRLSEADMVGLCRWLVEMDLAHSPVSSQPTRLIERASNADQQRSAARWNPLVFRLPLGRPDRLAATLADLCGWLFSPAAAIVWSAVVVTGCYQALSNWQQLAASSQGVFAPHNWLWLAASWLGLKILHETSHAVVCKRYGGTVAETGILFVLFAPLAYVDVTSSWRFRSRCQRMHVAAAGMYAELFVAGVAAIVWSSASSGWLANICFNIIAMASFTTLIFNANPLMKFDGYYLLSDALELPNLYLNGQAYLRHWGRRYLLGIPAVLPEWPLRDRLLIAAYGWAALLWRVVVCCSLTITATTLFHGAGIALALLAAVLWFAHPALRFTRYLLHGAPGEQPNRLRFGLTVGTSSLALGGLLVFVPSPGASRAPAVVEYAPHTVVRAGAEGFVSRVLVESGEQVEAGQLLAIVENRELARDVADLALQVRQSEIRGRRYEQQGKLAAQQAELEQRLALETQHQEKSAQLAKLRVCAPRRGKVIGRQLASLLGQYVKEGDEIVSIGDDQQKELRVSIAQEDLETFAARVGQPLSVDVPRFPLWRSQLKSVIPRATLALPHPSLAAVHGGPLAVEAGTSSDATPDVPQLLAARFTAIVSLDRRHAQQLSAGQQAHVVYRPFSQSLGEHCYRAASNWIRQRLSL